VGVAGVSCTVLGRIPARTVSLVLGDGGGHGSSESSISSSSSSSSVVDRSPSICVLEEGIGGNSDGVELLLGLDALEEWNAAICLRDRTLTIRSPNTMARGGGGSGEEDDLIIPFMNSATGGSSGGGAPPLPKKAHRPSRGFVHTDSRRIVPMATSTATKKTVLHSSPSIPWVASKQRKMPPTTLTDLESDLDLLDSSTNNGVMARRVYNGGMDRLHHPSEEGGGGRGVEEEEEDAWVEDDDSWDDDDDEYFESDLEYDGCNLSGI